MCAHIIAIYSSRSDHVAAKHGVESTKEFQHSHARSSPTPSGASALSGGIGAPFAERPVEAPGIQEKFITPRTVCVAVSRAAGDNTPLSLVSKKSGNATHAMQVRADHHSHVPVWLSATWIASDKQQSLKQILAVSQTLAIVSIADE